MLRFYPRSLLNSGIQASRLCLLAFALLGLQLSGCAKNSAESAIASSDRRLANMDVNEIYDRARTALDGSDFTSALRLYSEVETRYPFSDQARQALIESAYAHYRLRAYESSIANAERFISQYPRHPNIDYAYYIKGLSSFARATDDVGGFLAVDGAKRGPNRAREAFFNFSRLINQFPDSSYTADAQQRMVFLRERMARYELYVAEYYMKRRGWLAAANRAQNIVQEYQGTAAVPEALKLMEEAYIQLGLSRLATDAAKVRYSTYGGVGSRSQRAIEKPPEPNLQPPQIPSS